MVWRRVYWAQPRLRLKKTRSKVWTKAVAQMADAIPSGRLHARVLKWLECEAKKDETWAVAVSGGADSVALLLLLWAHFPNKRNELLVLHYDHGLRPDSAADAKFVEELASELGVGFASARRAPRGAINEGALRDARMDFFRAQLAARKARIIFFGHQLEDIAETMLIRLARGSGASALCAPRPVRFFSDDGGMVALRPLLDIRRGELRGALQRAGVVWREDSTNEQGHYLRNRLRHQVIPAWRAAEPTRNLDAAAARARAALEEEADALEAITGKLLHDLFPRECAPGLPLPVGTFPSQHRAVVRRALNWWLDLNERKDHLNANAFNLLLEKVMAAQSGRWSAGSGRWLVLDKCWLSLSDGAIVVSSWPPVAISAGGVATLPSGAKLASRIITVSCKLLQDLKAGKIRPAQKTYLALPAGFASESKFIVRPWQPGDRYRPLGAPGRSKLQDLFTDKKIPAKERHRIPVVCNAANEPIWAPGLPPAHSYRLTAATRVALELTYRPLPKIIDTLST